MKEKIASKEFREDLFFRLQIVPITIAPLRERVEEILPIAEIKLKEVCDAYHLGPKSFSKKRRKTPFRILLAWECTRAFRRRGKSGDFKRRSRNPRKRFVFGKVVCKASL